MRGAPTLHRSQIAAGSMSYIAEIARTVVGHGVMFEISPNTLDRVHVGCVGRQVVDRDLPALSLDVRLHELRAVGLQAIPYDEQLLANRGLQRFEELDDLGALDRAVEQSEIKAPVAQARDHRELFPAEAILQHGRLTFRCPGSGATRSFGQTRLVDEDDYSTLSRSDFFSSGHLLAFHVRTARSSRSRAWPVGRCTLQPSRPSKRQTEVGTSFTQNCVSISCAIRGAVHNSVEKPAASAPSLSNRTSSWRCAALSRPGRPKCGARRSASMPPSRRARSQRITVWRDTPTRRATSAWLSPPASNRAPRRRRRSSAFLFCECLIRTSNVTIPGTWTASAAKSVTHLCITQ